MHKSGQCPRCESRRVAVVRKCGPYYISEENIRDRYFCADCGYCETYYRTPQAWVAALEEGTSISEDWAWLNPPPDNSGPYR